MLRRRLVRIATVSGAFAAPGLAPLRAMSPPAPEPVDEVLSVTVTRPPEHPGAFLIVAKGRTRLDGRPSNMVLRQNSLGEMARDDAIVHAAGLRAALKAKRLSR